MAAAVIGRREEVPWEEPVVPWSVHHLLSSASDPDPVAEPEPDGTAEDLRNLPPSGIRSEAARGLMRVASMDDVPSEVRAEVQQAIVLLSEDPASRVRLEIAGNLTALYSTDESLFWRLAEGLAEHESSFQVLLFLSANTLSRLLHRQPGRVVSLAVQILERTGPYGGSKELADHLLAIMAVGHAVYAEPEADVQLRALLSLPFSTPDALDAVIRPLRGALIYDDGASDGASIRARAISVYERVANRAQDQFAETTSRHADRSTLSPDDEQRLRAALEVLDTVAAQVSFAIPDDRQIEKEGAAPADVGRLMREARGLLELLADVKHPGTHSHFVDLLVKTVHEDPAKTIRLLARSLGTGEAEIDLRHNEQLILDDVLKIIRAVLADHRDLIQSDREMRESLIAILDGFVRAGWLKAYEMAAQLEGAVRSE